MIHPHTQVRYVSDAVGNGVFATRDIPMGTVVYVADALEVRIRPGDPRLSLPQYRELIDTYSYLTPAGTRVLSWDHAKYVNHCCHANTLTTGYGFEIAVRDIAAGEEVTDDYAMFGCSSLTSLSCGRPGACDQPCRGQIVPGDFLKYQPMWEQRVLAAMHHFARVDQPLEPLIEANLLTAISHWLDTGKGYRKVARGSGAAALLGLSAAPPTPSQSECTPNGNSHHATVNA